MIQLFSSVATALERHKIRMRSVLDRGATRVESALDREVTHVETALDPWVIRVGAAWNSRYIERLPCSSRAGLRSRCLSGGRGDRTLDA